MIDVLVIDDDPGIRRLLGRVLTGAGYQVREATNGVDGIAAFRTQRPALVITDIVMPEKEGIEIIREIRQEAPGAAILAISGSDPHGDLYLHAATSLGADAALAKPFRPHELLAVVADLLSGAPIPDES